MIKQVNVNDIPNVRPRHSFSQYIFDSIREFLESDFNACGLYFLAGSGFAIVCGSVAIWCLVRFCGIETSYSFVVNVLVSVAVNFVVRKFFVFKG